MWFSFFYRLEMITVTCDFIVVSMIHTKQVTNGTGKDNMANVECSILCAVRQNQAIWSQVVEICVRVQGPSDLG